VLATVVPHAAFEQSRIPKPKFTFSQRHVGSGEAHPSDANWPSMLLKHVWPQEGRAAKPVGEPVVVGLCVALAEEQYALPYAMIVLATAVPQAALAQSLMPKPKLLLLQRQYASGVEHPREENCASILLKQVWPQEGREPRPVVVVLPRVAVELDLVVE
jgi:hypothetical protein